MKCQRWIGEGARQGERQNFERDGEKQLCWNDIGEKTEGQSKGGKDKMLKEEQEREGGEWERERVADRYTRKWRLGKGEGEQGQNDVYWIGASGGTKGSCNKEGGGGRDGEDQVRGK